MKHSLAVTLGSALSISLLLSACGGGSDSASSDGKVTLTLAGWSLDSTPEFQTLADGFEATHSNVTVELKEYDATNYDTQMIADLAAGTAPDIYVQKNLKNFYTYEDGGQLLDVSDVASDLGEEVSGLSDYQVDGKTYAIPYRHDSWVLYYNKTLFEKAGVDIPDGTWTWDDYADAAEELTKNLKDEDALGTYQHTWQSTLQGFALAQTDGADLAGGDYSYLKTYYETALDLQDSGAQVKFGDATTNTLTYQAQFGKQSAAMMPMGTWYIATLLEQQKSGEADDFEWGIAPAPQLTESTTGTSATPVTFGDPTGLGINANIDEDEIDAAKEFLAYAAGEEGAKALAGIGITPANTTAVEDTFFDLDGVPTDDLSKFTFTTHDTKAENPVASSTTALQNILNDLHTAIMSESKDVDTAISEAQDRARSEVLDK